jgi:hypothetical protein
MIILILVCKIRMKIPSLQVSSGLWHGRTIETHGKVGLWNAMWQINKETSQKKYTFMYVRRFGKAKLDDWPASLFRENGGWQHLGISIPLMDLSIHWHQRSMVYRSWHWRMVHWYMSRRKIRRNLRTKKKVFLFHGATALSGPGPPNYQGLTITLRHTTLDRTPLDEWLARRRDLYLTTHNNHKRQIWIPRRVSNPQSQQGSCSRPTPHTAWPPGWHEINNTKCKTFFITQENQKKFGNFIPLYNSSHRYRLPCGLKRRSVVSWLLELRV